MFISMKKRADGWRFRDARGETTQCASSAIGSERRLQPRNVSVISSLALLPRDRRTRTSARAVQRRRTHSVARRRLVVVAGAQLPWWPVIAPTNAFSSQVDAVTVMIASCGACGGRVVPIGARGFSGKGASGFMQHEHATGPTGRWVVSTDAFAQQQRPWHEQLADASAVAIGDVPITVTMARIAAISFTTKSSRSAHILVRKAVEATSPRGSFRIAMQGRLVPPQGSMRT
jgi:hypothetical protein